MDEVQLAEEKKTAMASKEEARLMRLVQSDESADTAGSAGEGSTLSGNSDGLTPEEREMARLNKHWITSAPKVTAGLPVAPQHSSPSKDDKNDSPRKGGITIVRPSFAPKGSAAKVLEQTGETESQMLERRLREAKAKAYKKEKAEKEAKAWQEKEKEKAKQYEQQIQQRKQREHEERLRREKEAEERRERERKDLEERAKLEADRALKDSDPSVGSHVGSTSSSGDLELNADAESETARKEEARMKAHWL